MSSGQKHVATVFWAYIAFIFKPAVERLLQSKKNSTVRKISSTTRDSREAETNQSTSTPFALTLEETAQGKNERWKNQTG